VAQATARPLPFCRSPRARLRRGRGPRDALRETRVGARSKLRMALTLGSVPQPPGPAPAGLSPGPSECRREFGTRLVRPSTASAACAAQTGSRSEASQTPGPRGRALARPWRTSAGQWQKPAAAPRCRSSSNHVSAHYPPRFRRAARRTPRPVAVRPTIATRRPPSEDERQTQPSCSERRIILVTLDGPRSSRWKRARASGLTAAGRPAVLTATRRGRQGGGGLARGGARSDAGYSRWRPVLETAATRQGRPAGAALVCASTPASRRRRGPGIRDVLSRERQEQPRCRAARRMRESAEAGPGDEGRFAA
jgi:hypothetical protein